MNIDEDQTTDETVTFVADVGRGDSENRLLKIATMEQGVWGDLGTPDSINVEVTLPE